MSAYIRNPFGQNSGGGGISIPDPFDPSRRVSDVASLKQSMINSGSYYGPVTDAMAQFKWNQLTGNQATNDANVQRERQYIDYKNSQEFKPGKTITGLAASTILGGLGSAALGAVAPSLAAGTTAGTTTGVAAGNAAGSGLGTILGSNFAKDAAISGALKGGIGGFLSGGNLSDALKGAALGGLTGGYGGSLAKGLSLSGTAGDVFKSALSGAAGGLSQGNLSDALKGAAIAGGGEYLLNTNIFGNPAGTALDRVSGTKGLQGPTQGTGLTGALTRGISGLGAGGSLSLGDIGDAASGLYNYSLNEDNEDDLLAAQGRARAALSPYEQAGRAAQQQLIDDLMSGALGGEYGLDDFEADPGYQFRLDEGQKALERSLAARGLSQSGAALKEAQKYGQNLANTTFNDAFTRNLQEESQRYNMLSGQAGQGLGAAGQMANSYINDGNIKANARAASGNILTGTLSDILRRRLSDEQLNGYLN